MYNVQPKYVEGSDGGILIAINAQAVVYSKRVSVAKSGGIGLSAIMTGTTPDVKIEMEVSDTAPEAAEAVADSTDWCIQEGGAAIFASLADKIFHKITINPTPSRFIRLKITGNVANTADVKGKFAIVTSEQF